MKFAAITAFLGHAILSVQATNLRAPTPSATKSSETADKDLARVQTIEHSLQALAKQAHAPKGTDSLLKQLTKAESDLKAAKTKDARASVMKQVNADMAAFQADLVSRQSALKKEAAADEAKKVENLKPIVKRLEERLVKLNKAETDVRSRMKAREDSEKKASAKGSKQSKDEDQKTDKMLKYFAKKSKRTALKKLATWSAEKKAITEAIRLAKLGDAEGTHAAMEKVIAAEKGDSQFLY